MKTTIGDIIARVKNPIKHSAQKAYLTDRSLYSIIKKYAALIMRRQDSLNRIMKFNGVFQPLDFFELEEIDKIEAQCHCIESGCTFRRTKHKVPAMMEGYWGPLIREITSIDGSTEIIPTYPRTFEKIVNQKTYKYNKNKYYWFLNGYLYFPNIDWDAIRIVGVWDEDISIYTCDTKDNCISMQDRQFNVPEFMFAEIEQLVWKDLGIIVQIPDTAEDNKTLIE